jgi:hypothetical protein
MEKPVKENPESKRRGKPKTEDIDNLYVSEYKGSCIYGNHRILNLAHEMDTYSVERREANGGAHQAQGPAGHRRRMALGLFEEASIFLRRAL